MNKWRLLLFSVFGLLQITTSDRNFIDGRDRYCHHSLSNSKSDTRISIYEPFRVYSLLPELRQLKSPEHSRRERELEHRRSSYRPHINYREEHWRDSTSRRDENRRSIDRQLTRELTRDNEVKDVLRTRTNRQKLSTIASRDNYRQNDARIERSENRYVRLHTRETFPRNAREDFNIRRESLEREGIPARFTDRETMSTDTDSARQNRNNRQNARQIIFVRGDHEDLERRAQYFARREVFEARNAVNNLEERVSRLRMRQNFFNDEPRQSEEFRATRGYDRMATRSNVRFVRDSSNREELESLNENLRGLRESHTQTERNSRLIKRSVSDEMVREENSPRNNREYRETLVQRSPRVSETNRNIRLERQNEEKNNHKYINSRYDNGDFRRLTSNNLNIRSSNDENLFERDAMMRARGQNLRYTLRNGNNRDNRLQVLRERNEQRNNIDKHINLNRRDALNMIERHIQIDSSRHNIRDTRDIRTERSSEERTVRNDNEQRRGSVRAQAIDETQIRSNNRAKIDKNQGDNINESVQRTRSQSLINSRRTERSGTEERSIRQTARDTSLDKSNVHDFDLDLQQRKSRSVEERLPTKLDNRDASEYERRSRNSQERYRSVIQNARSNSDEEMQRIRSQALEERNSVRQALDKSIRRTNVQNIRGTSDNYANRVRSRSLEDKLFSITPERDQIRNNEKSRHVQNRSTKRQTTDESRIRSTSLPTSNKVQSFRYNVDEEFKRTRSQDMPERINGKRVSNFHSINVDIRDEVLTSQRFRIMQERLRNARNRYETRIRITDVRKALDDQYIRDNKDSHQQRPQVMDKRRSSNSQNMNVIIRSDDDQARRIGSRNHETKVMAKSIRINTVVSHRNIDVDSNRMRSRDMQERANRDETIIVIQRSPLASKSSEIRNININDEARQTRPATERFTDISRAKNIREKREFNENNSEKTDMRRTITLARQNRSRTIYRDIDNKQSTSSMFEIKWQYLFYAMQGIYLCSFFIKISKDEESKKKPRMNNWLTPMDMKID